MHTATHYLKVTMIVSQAGLDVVDATEYALLVVRARRLDNGEFMACWDLGEMAEETEEGGSFRVPLFAQVEAPGLTSAEQLEIAARFPEGVGGGPNIDMERESVAENCRFENIELIDLYANGAA